MTKPLTMRAFHAHDRTQGNEVDVTSATGRD